MLLVHATRCRWLKRTALVNVSYIHGCPERTYPPVKQHNAWEPLSELHNSSLASTRYSVKCQYDLDVHIRLLVITSHTHTRSVPYCQIHRSGEGALLPVAPHICPLLCLE